MRPYHGSIVIFLLLHIAITGAAVKNGNSYARFVNQFLATQNAARAALRMRPLVWDANLARYAQWYANQRRFDCALRHSDGPYGENIFWGSGTGWSPAQAAAAWVVEKKWYNYWSNSCALGQECGHYTQIVWRQTTRIGCARVTCFGGRGVFMTCNYNPPGNYIGERPY
ncbi:pathogenesis-related protein PR-1 [Coffea arabica]|uniref:Pathogenesis-related protein PR-1 n=1 Tax=Coffea arabica TaxID=13443 RepID=A0A6P6SVX8_COFAR|nr:pathogenesis-related protein PR-1-like [Coffea arabica]